MGIYILSINLYTVLSTKLMFVTYTNTQGIFKINHVATVLKPWISQSMKFWNSFFLDISINLNVTSLIIQPATRRVWPNTKKPISYARVRRPSDERGPNCFGGLCSHTRVAVGLKTNG